MNVPYYPPERAVQRGIDLAYGKSQITKRITSGILSGSSVPDIARSLRDGISTMGYVSSVRAARTAITSAQNGGRMAAYKEAEEMGLEFKRQWVATLDARTRHEHQLLDGQQAKNCEYSRVGRDSIEYPGDPRAPGYLVYNCRCTLKAVFPNQLQGRRIARSGEGTGAWEEVEQQTYKQWAESKGAVYDDSTKTVSVVSDTSKEARSVLKKGRETAADNLKEIDQSAIITIQRGFSAFPSGSEIARNVTKVKPIDDYYDIGLHGNQSGGSIGKEDVNATARLIARYVRSREDYSGQPIRLLSCNSGKADSQDICFAEQLANALGVNVLAPNDSLFIYKSGRLEVGDMNTGEFVLFTPNQRRRLR